MHGFGIYAGYAQRELKATIWVSAGFNFRDF